jgi:hypothetical protein
MLWTAASLCLREVSPSIYLKYACMLRGAPRARPEPGAPAVFMDVAAPTAMHTWLAHHRQVCPWSYGRACVTLPINAPHIEVDHACVWSGVSGQIAFFGRGVPGPQRER